MHMGLEPIYSFSASAESDIYIDEFEEGSGQLKVPSISTQFFVEGSRVLPCFSHSKATSEMCGIGTHIILQLGHFEE
jgi:hypothetical protein